MRQWNEYQCEHAELFEVPSDRLIQVLLNVLPKLGWENLDVCGVGLTANIIDTGGSPQNCFTMIITCIQRNSKQTELLLTVCSHHQAVSSGHKAVLILNEVSRGLAIQRIDFEQAGIRNV